MTPQSAGDDLLRWASEAGSGSWERLRDASAYLCQRHNLRWRPWQLASELSALGHMDIDWDTRAWSVAPPALNLVPGLGLWIVLTGSRPHYVDERFQMATDDMDVYPCAVQQPPAPAAKLAKCASVETAERVAERLGAALVYDPPLALATAMRAVDEASMKKAPEPSLEEAERFNPATLQWETDHARSPGLYRIDLHGRPVHRRLDAHGLWWSIDLAAGQFLELRDRRPPVLRWRPRGRRPPVMQVRTGLALPTLAERALRVSSGLRPTPTEDRQWKSFLNVREEVARIIADRLCHDLPRAWED